MCMLDGEDSTDQTDWNTCNRRAFLGVASVATSMLMANPANARDELFRPNLLTNPLLEQVSYVQPIRIVFAIECVDLNNCFILLF
jgi:hypothetical protein